tara:strand:+ start:95 stop:259 length:165 start_codon:yes stop_codon:yes gene_type:complete
MIYNIQSGIGPTLQSYIARYENPQKGATTNDISTVEIFSLSDSSVYEIINDVQN